MLVLAVLLSAPFAEARTLKRVSVDSNGNEGHGTTSSNSERGSVSPDGRFVAFSSDAVDLVPGDTNGQIDVFLHDNLTGQTSLVSIGLGGAPADGASRSPVVSQDGRFVAFQSLATNLVPSDTNGQLDIFLRDMTAGTTLRASVDSAGAQANDDSQTPSLSRNGRYVAFTSSASNLVSGDANGQTDVFVHDAQTHVTVRTSVDSGGVEGNAASRFPSLSGDGRYVAFASSASNLVVGDTNNATDAFVRDLIAQQTVRVSLTNAGAQSVGGITVTLNNGPAISADGRFVAFASDATDLVPGDTNGQRDIFVRDIQGGTTTLVSLASNGSQGNGTSFTVGISGDGRMVAFRSQASNLVAGDTNGTPDVFLRDVAAQTTELLSPGIGGNPANGPVDGSSSGPVLSDDGSDVGFSSDASNLVAGDTNAMRDYFVSSMEGNECTDPALACFTTCSKASPNSVARTWISVPQGCIKSAEDLCQSIPLVTKVDQMFSTYVAGYSYDCVTHACTSPAGLGIPEVSSACSSNCFCVDPGEGVVIETTDQISLQIDGTDVATPITVQAGKEYLLSIPFHTTLHSASDLFDTLNASVGVSYVTKQTCFGGILRWFGEDLGGVNFAIYPGEAFNIGVNTAGTFTLPFLPPTPPYPSCTCIDNDGDGYGSPANALCQHPNRADCNNTNNQVWSTPGEVQNLALSYASSTVTLSWNLPLDPGGSATLVYDTIRSKASNDFVTPGTPAFSTCIQTANPALSSSDAGVPVPNTVFFYLVRADNPCGPGVLGVDSNQIPKNGRTCP